MVGTDLFQYQCPPAARKNMTASCSRWRDGIAVASRVVRKWYSKFRKSELRKSVINGKSDVSVVQSVQVHFIDYSANVNTRWFGISPRGTWCTWSLDMSSEQIWFFCAVHIIFAIDTLNNLLMREQKPQSTTVTGGDHIFGINIRSCIPRYTSHLKLPPLPGILPLWVANSAASLRARWWTWEVNGVESNAKKAEEKEQTVWCESSEQSCNCGPTSCLIFRWYPLCGAFVRNSMFLLFVWLVLSPCCLVWMRYRVAPFLSLGKHPFDVKEAHMCSCDA